MAQDMLLIGAEDVRRASYEMKAAAQEMQMAASMMQEAVGQLMIFKDQFITELVEVCKTYDG